jgi:hypothetical protein
MCPPRCTRTEDVDPRTTTGAYHIVSKTIYGRRPGDKPRWWPFAFHAYKAIVQVVTVLGLAWVLKRLGLTAP